jgi:hypothetical protein
MAPASSTLSAKGVDHGRIGERVWLWNAQWKRPFGTAAEFATCRRNRRFICRKTSASPQALALASPQ